MAFINFKSDIREIQEMCNSGMKAIMGPLILLCQMKLMEVEFFAIVLREITGQKFAI